MKRLFFFFVLTIGAFTVAGCDTFEEDIDIDSITVNVSATIEDVSVEVAPGEIVPVGETVTLSAPMVDGYTFIHWLDENEDVLSTEAVYSFTASEDVTIEAVYETDNGEEDADNGEDDTDNGDAAQSVMDAFEGDLSHMESMMTSFEQSDTMEMTLDVFMDMEGPNGNETVALNLVQRADHSTASMSETRMSISGPGVPPDMSMGVIIRETPNFYEAYVDIGYFLDMIEEEEDVDAREIFGFESDTLHIIIPQEMRESFDELFTEAMEESFVDADIDEALIEELTETLDDMIEYYDFAYFASLDALEVDAEIVDETDILTSVTLTPEATKDVFEDVFEDVYPLLMKLESDADMPEYEAFILGEEYQNALATIESLEPMHMSMRYAPATQDRMHMEFDMLEFMSQFEEELDLEGIHSMDIAVTMDKDVDITIPTDARDIYDLSEEFFMMVMLDESLYYARSVDGLDISDDTYTLQTITDDYGVHFGMPFVDMTQSTVDVSGDTLTLDFVYETNGQDVFDTPVTLSELEALGIDADEAPQTRAEFLAIIDPMDRDAIAIQTIMVDMLERLMDETEPVMPEEPDETFPESDLVDFNDYPSIDRPPQSIMSEAVETQEEKVRVYYTELSSQEVFEFYQSAFSQDDAWTVDEMTYIADQSMGLIELSDGNIDVTLVMEDTSTFDGSTSVLLLVEIDVADDGDPQDLPQNDEVTLSDLEHAPRYIESIMIEGFADEGENGRVYASDDGSTDIYDFYVDYYENSDMWTIETQSIDVNEGSGYMDVTRQSDDARIYIAFYESDRYQDAWEIGITFSHHE